MTEPSMIRRTEPDHYEVLGVARDATRAEIAATYRALARVLHPDTGPAEPDATERFGRVTTAYRVLVNPEARRSYDERRAARPAPRPPIRAEPPRGLARLLRTRRSARMAVVGGIASIVLGVVAAGLVIGLQARDAALRRDGVATTATVVETAAGRRLAITTADGQQVLAPEPVEAKTGRVPAGDEVEVRYDPDDPTDVVIVDESTGARDLTFWIVAVKLLVAGAVFVVLGTRRLGQLRTRTGRQAFR